MAHNSSINLDIANLSVGFSIGGGVTKRTVTHNGNGDYTLTNQFAGAGVYAFPNRSSDTLIGFGDYNAKGAILVGTGTGTFIPLTIGVNGLILTTDSTQPAGVKWTSAPATISQGFYGDGSDGTPTFDGSSTVLGMVPSGNTYTLTRDILPSSLTVNSGVSIITNNFRIYCSGTLTNNGTIQYNGLVGAVGGAGGAGISPLGTLNTVGGSGGAGSTGVGSSGVAPTSYCLGGNGGAGGTGTSAGGAGGVGTAPFTTAGSLRTLPQASIGAFIRAGSAPISANGGSGGGGGGGDGSHSGGGGGGAAGFVLINAYLFSGTGNIQAIGGNGGAGAAGSTKAGGGGGGGGGLICIVSRSISGGAIPGQTLSVSGGIGGNGVGAGAGNGTAGNTGSIILLPN